MVTETVKLVPRPLVGKRWAKVVAQRHGSTSLAHHIPGAVPRIGDPVAQAHLNVLRAEKILVLAQCNVSSLQDPKRDARNLFKERVANLSAVLIDVPIDYRDNPTLIQAMRQETVV